MYKEIIVCVNEAEGRENVVFAAARFAKKINANLTGLYCKESTDYLGSSFSISPYGVGTTDLVKLAQERDAKLAAKASDTFQNVVGEVECKSSWLEIYDEDNPLRAVIYSDLIITNQVNYDPRQGHSNIGFVNSLVLGSGKPVILIPTEWDKPEFGKNVIIGWDESREATRAIQDAMPILKGADSVDALFVNCKKRNEELVDVSEISNYLSKHEVANNFHLASLDEEANTPEKVLMNFTAKTSSDLIVVGGYGHTRLREIVLGGVTRNLSKNSKVPVLFSH